VRICRNVTAVVNQPQCISDFPFRLDDCSYNQTKLWFADWLSDDICVCEQPICVDWVHHKPNCDLQIGCLMIFVSVNSPSVSTEFITSPGSWVAFITNFIHKTMAVDECCVSGEAASDYCTNEWYRERCFCNVLTDWSGTQPAVRSWTSALGWFVSSCTLTILLVYYVMINFINEDPFALLFGTLFCLLVVIYYC